MIRNNDSTAQVRPTCICVTIELGQPATIGKLLVPLPAAIVPNTDLPLHQPTEITRDHTPSEPPFLVQAATRTEERRTIWRFFRQLKLTRADGEYVTQDQVEDELEHFVRHYTDSPVTDDIIDDINLGTPPLEGAVNLRPATLYEDRAVREHVFLLHIAEVAVTANA